MTIPTRKLLTLLARFADGYGSTDAAVAVAVEGYEAGYKDGRDYEAQGSLVPSGTALAAILDALRRGAKIEAIKHWRAATHGSLREGKDFVEALGLLSSIGGF
jgi:ribosomal protein L7/L12